MASESSFDVVSQFDFQELKNAFDQTQREVTTRYDLKGSGTELELNDDDITLTAPDAMKLKAVKDILSQKLVNRKLSPKILDVKDHEPSSGGNLKQVIKLIKTLDQDTCKLISKHIRDSFPKAKSSIQGDTVRVSSKSKDELQTVMTSLSEHEGITSPIQFTNYR